MLNLNATLIAVILNFAILVFLLNKLLYKPILKAMGDREAMIADSVRSAQEAKQEAERLQKSFDSTIREADAQARSIMEEAHAVSDKVRRDAMASAKLDAESLRHRARQEAERIRQDALISVKDEVAVLATEIAAKLISKGMDQTIDEMDMGKLVGEARS